jgi:3-hydroxybutyryl-CoA dehydrogenase
MTIKNVTIAGGGTLGSQIAWQTAFHGFNVIVYDAFEKGVDASKVFHKQFADLFLTTRGASQAEIDATFNRIKYTTDLGEAIKDADLLSESIPEVIEIKKDFYEKLAKVAPEKTIFTSNSSTTLPSDYAHFTGRPEKFLALHFANGIWKNNVGEVMGHPGTDPKVFDRVVEFAKEIGMVPIPLNKEQNGYVLNSLMLPFVKSGLELLINGVADMHSIDKTWMISFKGPMGPFGVMDAIGLETMYHIESLWAEKSQDQEGLKRAKFLKEHYIDKGKLGKKSGEGFYTYPNPDYLNEDFLK